jgi:type I restriction enzyme S subunit
MEENQVKIPNGWELNKLSSLVSFATGNRDVNEGNPIGEYPFFTCSKKHTYSDDYSFDEEALLIAGNGDVGTVHYYKGKFEAYQRTYVLRDFKTDVYFLYHLLKSDLIPYLLSGQSGTTIQFIKIGQLYDFQFLSPKSPTEQRQIATILSKVDEAITQTEQLIAKYQRIKTGLMQDLLTKGIDENGNELVVSDLKKIRINSNFIQTSFSRISKVRQGYQIAISKRKKEEGTNRYIYITVQYLNSPDKYLEFIENPPEGVLCKEEEVLFTRTGNTGQIVTGIEGVFHNNFFKVSFDEKKINKDYLIIFLNWEPIQDLIKELAGTTTIPDLKHKDFYGMPVFFPNDLTEQNKIALIINRCNQHLKNLYIQSNKLQSQKTGLMQDLLSGKVRVNHLIKETERV